MPRYQIGKRSRLTERAQLAGHALEIAGHLAAEGACPTEADHIQWLEVYATAASEALGAGSVEAAQGYLTAAWALFREEDWSVAFDLGFQLGLPAAEAAFRTEAPVRTPEILEQLQPRARNPFQLARVLGKRTRVMPD